jgi:hypothetical protein
MKQYFASWFSHPGPRGLQYEHMRPAFPPGTGAGCGSGAGGAGWRVVFGAGAAGVACVTSGVCVSRSRAWQTTSAQTSVAPYSAAFVARMFSSDVCIAWSNFGTKQCIVASSFAPSDRRSYSTRSMKLAELSFARGRSPKYLAFSWLCDSPNSRLTTDLKSPQSVKLWCW